jgi:hypothetical protein
MFYVHQAVLDWEWYVTSIIDFDTGKWTATYASENGLTPVGPNGPDWNAYQLPPPTHPIMAMHPHDPADPAQAQYGGRLLARSLISIEAWDKGSKMFEGRDMAWSAQ